MSDPKPVTLIVVNACKIDGKHVAVGEILTDVEFDLACELTGAGRTRLATDDDLAAAASAKKPAKAAA